MQVPGYLAEALKHSECYMLALRYIARLLLKMHPGSRYLTGALEKLHTASWRPPLPRLPALPLADFPVGRTTPGGKHHPRT